MAIELHLCGRPFPTIQLWDPDAFEFLLRSLSVTSVRGLPSLLARLKATLFVLGGRRSVRHFLQKGATALHVFEIRSPSVVQWGVNAWDHITW